MLAALRAAAFGGAVYPVTPTYDEIEGWACLAEAGELPGAVDLAVIAGAATRVPEQLQDAIAAGARSAFVLANAAVADASGASVLDQVRSLVAASGIPLLGPNSLGFVNFARGVAVTWTPAVDMRPGPVALVSQSGSTYSYANNLDPRIRFSFTAHAGQEVSVGVADLIRYALSLAETRVVGIYLETAAAPAAVAGALAEAAEREIPIVAIRPGRSERSRQQIESHAGRMAGSDAAFEALFRAYGVARTTTVDEWWATLALLAAPRRPARGGLGAVMCSGGARAILLDDGDDLGVPFADVSDATRARLAELLTPGTPAENPVDVWDGQADLATHATACLRAVVEDDDTAIAIAFTDLGAYDPAGFPGSFAAACRTVAGETAKPVAAATYTSRQFHPAVMHELAAAGIPVLDGMRNAVAAVGHALAVRDFQARRGRDAAVEPGRSGRALPVGSPIPRRSARPRRSRCSRPTASRCRRQRSWRTPMRPPRRRRGSAFRSSSRRRWQRTSRTSAASCSAWRRSGPCAARTRSSSARLGPSATIAAQVPTGVEIAVGVVRDPQFGPILMVAAGGELVEVLDDRRFLLAPAAPGDVRRALAELRVARLLDGARGRPACDVDGLARTISMISAIATAAGDVLAELDVNPIIVSPVGCVAVDALIVRAGGAG